MEPRRGRPPHPEPVTPAEAKVLELVREGYSNAEIAVRLSISVNTVRYHISNLLSKAGAAERNELKEWQPGCPESKSAWGWLGLLLKPKLAAAVGSVAAGSVAVLVIAGSLVNHQPAQLAAGEEQPAPPFQGAVVGELIRQGSTLAIVESATGEAFVLTDPLTFGRYVGRTVFIVGEIAGRELTPTAGTVVGPLSRCAGVLAESNGTVSIKGGCGGMEIVGLSLDQLIAFRSERVMINVLACTTSTGGRLSNPHVSLYDSGIVPTC